MLVTLFQQILFTIASLFIWNFVSTLFHELGHFLCAKLVGLNPVLIVIGRNIIFKTRFFFDSVVMVGIIPFGGFTYVDLPILDYLSLNKFRRFKIQHIICYLGGVLGNFTCLVLMINIYLKTQYHIIILLIIFELGIICVNIIPDQVLLVSKNETIKIPNDGQQILSLILEGYRKYYTRISQPYREYISKYTSNLVYEEPIFNNNFNQLRILNNAIIKLAAQKVEQAIADLISLLSFPELSIPERVYILDYLSSTVITEGKKHYLDKADKWSEEAVSLAGHSTTIQCTRGMVLVELGEYIEGQQILMKILPSVKEIEELIFIHCYLAKVDFCLGNLEDAKRRLKTAKKYSKQMGYPPAIIKETEVAISSRKN